MSKYSIKGLDEIGCDCCSNHKSCTVEHYSDEGSGPQISCDHDHGHHHHSEEGEQLFTPLLITGIFSFAVAIILRLTGAAAPAEIGWNPLYFINIILFFIAYLCIGKNVILSAVSNIRKGEIFDENFLMMVASLGAFCIGEYPEAVAVMLFYRIGEHMQDKAVEHSRRSISDLMDIRPDEANLMVGDETKTVPAETIKVGDIIIVKPGERIPLDGVVTVGESTIDTKALTGESLPLEVKKGDTVLSGSINTNGMLTVKVIRPFHESTATKILEMVETASSKKAKTENFITKFARVYTPVVVGFAVLLAILPPLLIPGATFTEWINRALVFLVVSCPCALVISIPLSFFAGIGAASSRGVMVKGGNYLEALKNVDTIVFDKTGTLTTGEFSVTKVLCQEGTSEDHVLAYAARGEAMSNHPIAQSIRKAYQDKTGKDAGSLIIQGEKRKERSGFGVEVVADQESILVGNGKLMEDNNIKIDTDGFVGTKVYVAVNGTWKGTILIEDTIKDDSWATIELLRKVGISEVNMFTGDNKEVATKVGSALGLDYVYSELLPNEKVEALEEIFERKGAGRKAGKVAFVGDGINDSPVLARADVGIAMGGIGSDAAIEAADVVIMTDEPGRIIDAIKVARSTNTVVWQNIVMSLGIKFAVLLLAAFGMANMWEAVFADVGVAILAVLNSIRIK